MKEDGRALIGQLFCFYVPSLSEGDVLIGKLFFIVHTHEEDVTKMIKGVKTYCTMNHLRFTYSNQIAVITFLRTSRERFMKVLIDLIFF